MFDYESMVQRAIKFFPTWSDIRKRYKKSNGGKLLSSITEQSVSTEKAIQEYIDYYFLTRYEGKESTVMDYAYRTNIGIIENISKLIINYKNKDYTITNKIEEFNSDCPFYYEQGYIYMQYNIYTSDTITVKQNNNSLDYKLELYHVWNIYDEFACFIGLERHERETNKELYDRMIYFNKNVPNGSELGLKHAIISELMIYEPNISEDDIIIEKVNETNLRQPYQDFNELLDKLNEMNRDVYRWKRWDLDSWTYDFTTLSYLPYKWNETLTAWQNGIGYNDDLNVIVSNNVTSTNASISLYKKSQEKLLHYIQNTNLYHSINFNLKMYKDILSSIPINYKIQASPLREINPTEFIMNIYENSYVDEKVLIESLFSIGNDIVKIDNSNITDIYPYRLQFVPKNDNYDIEIKKCRVLYKKNGRTDHIKDLLKPTSGFATNSLGYLVSSTNKKVVSTIGKLNSYKGLINVDNNLGFTLANGIIQGSGSISINGLGGNKLNYSISCDMSELPKNNIKYNTADCEWNNANKQLKLFNNGKEKTIEIDMYANQISFDIQCDNTVLVYVYNEDTDNWNQEEIIGPNTTWKSKESKNQRNIKIKINSNSNDTILLGNFKYSKYDLEFSTEKNKILFQNHQMILPNLIDNTLYFKLTSYSGSNPIVKGIYIGEDVSGMNYVTETFEYESGFTRVLEIESNCTVNLLKMNYINSKTESIIYDYNASTSYKANSDNSFIRLNLDKYDSIDRIYSTQGTIEMIEESGVIYYNLRLNKGDTVSYIYVVGNKHIEKEGISLYNMISTYNPKFDIGKDKVYCSRLLNGILISNNGSNNDISIMQLDSNLFAGLNILKYEFNSMPDNFNIIWGNSNTEKNYNYIHTGDFEYISFFGADDQIHTALNSYNLFINEVHDIKIVNNFNPTLQNNILYYYIVEPYDNAFNADIRFYNSLQEISFDKLKKWAVGYSSLSIKCDLDLMNSKIYNISENYISEEVKLNQLIPIKEFYLDGTIHTTKCVIEDNEDMTVIYESYDGSSNTDELVVKEVVEIQNDGFKKLEYSNIDKILYIGTDMSEKDNNFTDYNLLNKEGILIWNNLYDNIGKILYIRYTIKKPIAFLLSDEFLYKAISYNINAYKEISRHNIKDMKNGDSYDLNNLKEFKDSNLAYVSCSEPTFETFMENDKIIFNKYSQENNILIKTGYYYINGKEYYLFSNDTTLELDTNDDMYSENINIENGQILTYKTTDNRLKNTSMIQKGVDNLFNFDYSDTMVNGISNFGKLTSCESFYKWKTNGLTISLTNEYSNIGCNGLALLFSNCKEWGYSYIDITDYLYNDKTSYISFISTGIDVYIGTAVDFINIDINEPFSIILRDNINSNTNLKTYSLDKDEKEKYYIIVKGNGVLDDIIITDNEKEIYNCHNKNIDQLGLLFDDNKTEGDIYKLELNDKNDYSNYCAGICSDGYIRTTSKLDWNITLLKNYSTKSDWLSCESEDIIINESYIQAIDNNSGYILTGEPVFIDNPYTINRLVFKVNDLDIKELQDIKISIYTSNERNGQYRLYTYFDNNYGFVYGDYISRYIKVRLDIPKNKVVTNFSIYAEYKSDSNNLMYAETLNNGYLISNIFDSQECLRYKISNINIDDISDKNDIEFFIKAANDINVWTEWKELDIDDPNLKLNNVRYFKIKILIKSKHAYVKFNSIDLEVIN